MRETKKSKIFAKNALNKKGKNASMKSKHISQTFRAFLLSIYFSKIISEIHAFKIQSKSKQGFEMVKEKERHVPRLLQNRRRAYGKKKKPES